MELKPTDITIAITVYSRREYVLDAIRSALAQTVPVRVMVVEDCGPDAGLREFVRAEFGDRIDYLRNPKNRGLFDNWNACIDVCPTPWLCILHDDDQLAPNFVATMIALAGAAPNCAFYRGQTAVLEEGGRLRPPPPIRWEKDWQPIDLIELSDQRFVMLFAGILFSTAAARAVGGARANSYYTGDWDLWFRLALHGGAAQSAAVVAMARSHDGADRGSTRVERKGWRWALENVQRKRNLACLRREKNLEIRFDRTRLLEHSPIASRVLRRYASGYSRRILKYNAWLFTHSKPPHWRYRGLQILVRMLGPQFLKFGSKR